MQIFYSLPNHNTPENLIDIYENCFQSNVVFFYCVLSICIVYLHSNTIVIVKYYVIL